MRKQLVYGLIIAATCILCALGILPLYAQPQGSMSLFEVLSPTPGQIVEGPKMPLSVNFRSDDGTAIIRFDVYLDGKMFYGDKPFGGTFATPMSEGNFSTLDSPAQSPDIARAQPTVGAHTVTISLTDARGRVSVRTVSITYQPLPVRPLTHIPPKVRITSPVNGATIDGQTVVKVDAQPGDYAVALVKLYIDGKMWSMTNQQPYTMSWNPIDEKFTTGSHTLLAHALDLFNDDGVSEPVLVVVKNPYMDGDNPTGLDTPMLLQTPALPHLSVDDAFSTTVGRSWTPQTTATLPTLSPAQSRSESLPTAPGMLTLIPAADLPNLLPAAGALTPPLLAGFNQSGSKAPAFAMQPITVIILPEPTATHTMKTPAIGSAALPAFTTLAGTRAPASGTPRLPVSIPALSLLQPVETALAPIPSSIPSVTNVVIDHLTPLQPREIAMETPNGLSSLNLLNAALPALLPVGRNNEIDMPSFTASSSSRLALPGGAPRWSPAALPAGSVQDNMTASMLLPLPYESSMEAPHSVSPFALLNIALPTLQLIGRQDARDAPALLSLTPSRLTLPAGAPRLELAIPVMLQGAHGENTPAIALLPMQLPLSGPTVPALHNPLTGTTPAGPLAPAVTGPQTPTVEAPVVSPGALTPTTPQPTMLPPAPPTTLIAPATPPAFVSGAGHVQVINTATPATVMNQHHYMIKPGDTLSRIAARFHTSIVTLMKLNGGSIKLLAGKKLIVPVQVTPGSQVTLDNAAVKPYVTPYVTGAGYTMVSLRALVEASGGFLIWAPKSHKVDAWVKNSYLGVTIGQRKALIDQQVYLLPIAATMRRARTMVPLRFVVDGLHLDLAYDPSCKTYSLTSPVK